MKNNTMKFLYALITLLICWLTSAVIHERNRVWFVAGESEAMSQAQAYNSAMDYGADYIFNSETNERIYTK